MSQPGTHSALGLVLVANDHEWTARSVETILVASGYDVVRTFTGRETLEVALRRRPHALILDHQLPDISGLEVCRILKSEAPCGASLPIMLTTAGPSGRTQRMAAYDAGAWDFYGQPLDGEALLHKIGVYIAARKEVLEVAERGLIDSESGLYNRSGLEKRASELVSEARRTGGAVTCVAVAAPDHGENNIGVSSRLLEAVRRSARSADARGRLGPTTFAVVVGGGAEVGRKVADRLESAIGSDQEFRIVVSAADPASLITLEGDTLLDRAATELAAA